MAKTLLIIGGGVEQTPAYEKAKARGLTIVATDGSVDAPALQLADTMLLASTRNAGETVRVVGKYAEMNRIDGVMTIANDVPYTVARVAEALGLPGISVEAGRCASDKLMMKERFKAHGVSCPWFQAINSLEELESVVHDRPTETFVLKPVDGRGARGVLAVHAGSDLVWAFAESTRWGDSGRLMIEAYISGPQPSTESFLLDGKLYTAAVSERCYDRLAQFAPYFIEDGGTLPMVLSPEQLAAIDDVLLRGAQAMGIDQGIVKGDLVLDADGNPLVIEIAARISGGWFATHMIPAATGIDLTEAVMSLALGETVSADSLLPTRQQCVASRFWFPPPGRITAIHGAETLDGLPGMILHGFYRGVGDIQPEIKSHPDRFGYVLMEADTREAVLERIASAIASVTVAVEPIHPEHAES